MSIWQVVRIALKTSETEWTSSHKVAYFGQNETADLLRKHGAKMGAELKAKGK